MALIRNVAQLFISYTQDNPQRMGAVRTLADGLKSEGIDVLLDQYQPPSGPLEGWPVWCGRVAETAEKVLIIASKNYLDCWHGRQLPGLRNGATHEALILQNRVYEGGAGTAFLRVACFDDKDKDFIPLRLKGLSRLNARNPAEIIAWADGRGVVAPAAVLTTAPTPVVAPTHPFDIQRASSPAAFVGRRRLLTIMEDLMQRGGGISLVGDARIGKSSVLAKLSEMAVRSGHAVALVDTQTLDGFDWPEIVRKFTSGAVQPTSATCSQADQAATLIANWAQRQPAKPVVLVDEAEALIRHLDIRFFERLRGMIEHLCLIFATRQTLPVLFREHRNTTSPFGNKMNTEPLGLLEEAAAQELAERAEPYSGLLRLWCGAHPYYLQLLGSCLSGSADVTEALSRFRATAADRLTEQWERLRPGERRGLQQAVQGIGVNPELRPGLHERGLLSPDGQAFGQVLHWWIKREDALNGHD